MNIFRKSRTERSRRSPETRDNSFRSFESDLSNLGTSVETGALRENVQEQSVMLAKIEQDLLPKYQSLKSWIRSAEWSGATRRQLEHRLNENIQDLQRIKRDLNKHDYTNLATYKGRLWELEYYYEHYEQVRQIITLWWRTSDIHSIIDSKQDVKRARRYEKSDAKYQQSMNAILHDTALTSLRNNDMERYEEYLEAVVNWQIEPSSHPFYQAHSQSFRMIQCTNPNLYQILAPSWTWRKQYITFDTGRAVVWTTTSSSRRRSSNPELFPSRIGNAFSEQLAEWFPDLESDPRKKEAWWQLASVVAIWWAVFMWYKMLKNLFSKKDKNPNKRRNALLRWGWLLAVTNSDRIISWVYNWFQDIRWWHPSEKIQATTALFEKYWFSNTDALRQAEMHVWAPVATMSALHFIPIYELSTKKIVEYKDNEFKFNYNNYEKYVKACDWTNEQKNTVLAAGQKLRDDNSINLWFAALGISDQNTLNSLAGWSKTKTLAECQEVQAWWENCVEWVWSGINAKLFEKWLKAKDLQSAQQIINEYNQNWWDTLKDDDKNKLIIKWMKDWLLEINDSNVDYKIEDMLNDPDIDLENMTIKWFKSWANEVKFKSYRELFNTAYLTKKIKYKFQWAKANSYEPFKINPAWQLKFDDKNRYEFFNGDTKIISRKSFINDFPTLKEYKNYYAAYLNERRQAENAADISSLDIVSKLWINFYSEKEGRDLNAKLKQIKDELRYYHTTQYWNPFKIINLNPAMMIEFTTIWQKKKWPWDISWLKTLSTESNKEKLLKYINDPTNKMWWSSN